MHVNIYITYFYLYYLIHKYIYSQTMTFVTWYFTTCSAALYLHSTFWRQIFYFLLHYINLIN